MTSGSCERKCLHGTSSGVSQADAHEPSSNYILYRWAAGTAELLNDIVDDSDPDLDLPQIWHLLQTAESCREMHPEHDWLHLTGFIHGVYPMRD